MNEGGNYPTKGSTDHDGDGKVYDVALHDEILETCQHELKLPQGKPFVTSNYQIFTCVIVPGGHC